jgi:hypothetical protein
MGGGQRILDFRQCLRIDSQHFVFKFHLFPLRFYILFLIIADSNLAAYAVGYAERFSITGLLSASRSSSDVDSEIML